MLQLSPAPTAISRQVGRPLRSIAVRSGQLHLASGHRLHFPAQVKFKINYYLILKNLKVYLYLLNSNSVQLKYD